VKKTSIILTLFFAILLSFAGSKWGLTESSEARYAEISKEMYLSGDYLHPTLLGIYHYHKPPLTYYITALGYALFGINEMGARFFLMLALFIQLILVYKITRSFYKNEDVATAAMLIYFSYPIVLAATKNLTTDAYLTCFIFAAVWSFINYKQREKISYLYLFYFLCGGAFLTKGPVGIMPPVLFATWYHLENPSQFSAGFHRYSAFLLGLLVSCSWFLLLVVINPGLLHYFIKHQLADRVASNAFSRTQPWWYYLLTIPLLGLPAIMYFAGYLGSLARAGRGRNRASAILLWPLGISLLVFSLSASKLVLYVLPLYLFIAMLSARHLADMRERNRKIAEKISFGYACLIFLALIVSCFIQIPYEVPGVTTIPLAVAGLLFSVIIYVKPFAATAIKAPLLNAWVMAVLLIALPFIMNRNDLQINSIKPLAGFIKAHSSNPAKATVAVYDYLLPSLSFYTNNRTITIDNGNAHAKRETQFEATGEPTANGYFKMAEPGSIRRLSLMLAAPGSFLVARKQNDLPDSLHCLRQAMHHKAIFDKWVIYY
jgi:4-amino-4-deoxy-L-arabinose transferase